MRLSDQDSVLFQRLARHEPELAAFLVVQRDRVRDHLEQAKGEQLLVLQGEAMAYRSLLQLLTPPTR